MEEPEDFALGDLGSTIHLGPAPFGSGNQDESRFGDHGAQVIFRSSIGDDDLMDVGKCFQTCTEAFKAGGIVQYRHNDADAGRTGVDHPVRGEERCVERNLRTRT